MSARLAPHREPRGALQVARGFGALLGRTPRKLGPILVVLWYGLIFGLSSRKMGFRPGPVGGSWMLNTGHAFLFGLLALWIVLALPRENAWPILRRETVALVLVIVLVLGALDELHQGSVPGRTMSVTDVITDLTGAACVLWIAAYAGSARALERGLRWRLSISVAACLVAGAMGMLAEAT
ncbi:MAG TPA: VanZ family protein [Planctomycetota bacterium]|nr:VanZ family protein [Planctomycetota bacterium]